MCSFHTSEQGLHQLLFLWAFCSHLQPSHQQPAEKNEETRKLTNNCFKQLRIVIYTYKNRISEREKYSQFSNTWPNHDWPLSWTHIKLPKSTFTLDLFNEASSTIPLLSTLLPFLERDLLFITWKFLHTSFIQKDLELFHYMHMVMDILENNLSGWNGGRWGCLSTFLIQLLIV